MTGFELTPVRTDARGNIDLDDLRPRSTATPPG